MKDRREPTARNIRHHALEMHTLLQLIEEQTLFAVQDDNLHQQAEMVDWVNDVVKAMLDKIARRGS